jgi:bla regulator protein blaR1
MVVELTNHIWQSTIFAVAAGLITMAFRRNRAQVRYWLWFSASFKFLVPFALLMSLGSRFEWAPVTQKIAAAPAVSLTVVQMSEPFPSAFALTPSTGDTHDWAAIALCGLWACGFAAIALIRFRGWLRIRAAVRASSRIEMPLSLEVRCLPGLLEPGVVGLFRPILLLPAGLRERLNSLQLEAVLAHELCHVRRRDNLMSAIHMIVEALFWFHPLVWWIGARLMEERERACDEAVLSLGNEPRDYVEAMLNICKSYIESPLSCVAGVTGANLKQRIYAILTGRVARGLTFTKKLVLAAAAMAALTIPIAVGILSAPRIRAQSQPAALKFEAASILRCDAVRKNRVSGWSPEKLFQSQCTSVQRLIQQAYGLFANGHWNTGSSLTVAGGPAWTKSERYQIDAHAAVPQRWAMMNGPMLQALLKDRFKLKFHRETRKVPVYALTVAKGGPNLQPFQGSCTPRDLDKPPSDADCAVARARENGFEMKAATIADLCTGFSVLLERHVIDETGIAGRFDIHVDMSGEDRSFLDRPRSLPALSDPKSPEQPILFDAARAAMQKLELNLEPATGPGEFLVIDRIERPTAD